MTDPCVDRGFAPIDGSRRGTDRRPPGQPNDAPERNPDEETGESPTGEPGATRAPKHEKRGVPRERTPGARPSLSDSRYSPSAAATASSYFFKASSNFVSASPSWVRSPDWLAS